MKKTITLTMKEQKRLRVMQRIFQGDPEDVGVPSVSRLPIKEARDNIANRERRSYASQNGQGSGELHRRNRRCHPSEAEDLRLCHNTRLPPPCLASAPRALSFPQAVGLFHVQPLAVEAARVRDFERDTDTAKARVSSKPCPLLVFVGQPLRRHRVGVCRGRHRPWALHPHVSVARLVFRALVLPSRPIDSIRMGGEGGPAGWRCRGTCEYSGLLNRAVQRGGMRRSGHPGRRISLRGSVKWHAKVSCGAVKRRDRCRSAHDDAGRGLPRLAGQHQCERGQLKPLTSKPAVTIVNRLY